MQINKLTNNNFTLKQLKLPLDLEKIIDISDSVYTFCDVMNHIDLTPYFTDGKGCKTYHPKCDALRLLKVILFAFMENGIQMEKRDEYAVDYIEYILQKYMDVTALDVSDFVYGCGHRKSLGQEQYEEN